MSNMSPDAKRAIVKKLREIAEQTGDDRLFEVATASVDLARRFTDLIESELESKPFSVVIPPFGASPPPAARKDGDAVEAKPAIEPAARRASPSAAELSVGGGAGAGPTDPGEVDPVSQEIFAARLNGRLSMALRLAQATDEEIQRALNRRGDWKSMTVYYDIERAIIRELCDIVNKTDGYITEEEADQCSQS